MRFSVLSSGSKANSIYLESSKAKILIDCGMSAKRTEERLLDIGVDPHSLNAIFVTHEHSDHVFGIPVFSRRYKLPIFANAKTLAQLPRHYASEHFKSDTAFEFLDMRILPFSIVHDAIEPVGFRIESDGQIYAQATDLGKVTPVVQSALSGVHSLLIESNHDIDMLWSCQYPWDLKQRISSTHGHLSNTVCSQLLDHLAHANLQHVVLGHISENSNTPDLALSAARVVEQKVSFKSLRCANPYQCTPLLEVAA